MRTACHPVPTTDDSSRAERTDAYAIVSYEQPPDGRILTAGQPTGSRHPAPAAPYKFICASHRDQLSTRYRRFAQNRAGMTGRTD